MSFSKLFCLLKKSEAIDNVQEQKDENFQSLYKETLNKLEKSMLKETNLENSKRTLENMNSILEKKVAEQSRQLEEKELENSRLKEQNELAKTEETLSKEALEAAQFYAKGLESKIAELEKDLKVKAYEQSALKEEDNGKAGYGNFYDAIIDIPSLKELVDGWDISIPNWEEYQRLSQKQCKILSVIGNYSKGKSFLLELLTGRNLLHGFNVNTQGISVIYLKDEESNQRPILALDTKGGGTPLQINDQGSTISGDIANAQLNNDSLTEKLRDHGATEDLLQNFILEQASIILIMVSDLTFEDQRLVNKITNKYKKDPSKKIMVIHNLFHVHHKNEAISKIENSILPSFILNESEYTTKTPDTNEKYYVDRYKKVPHLILAKQNSEAGDYYNKSTIRYILDSLNVNDNSESIDVIDSFHQYLQKNFSKYIQTGEEMKPESIQLVKAEDEKPVLIRLQNVTKIQMKAVVSDVFGDLQIFKDGFCPNYTLSKDIVDDVPYLSLRIECPDECKEVKYQIIHSENEFSLQVKGQKELSLNNSVIITNNRHHGEFLFTTTPLKKTDFNIYYDAVPVRDHVNGIYYLHFKLKDKTEDEWN